MIDQASSKQIISLWIGKQSQSCAHSFYNLQAQQIFDQQQDPLVQTSIWKNVKKLQPRMIIFDTQIQRLAAVRQMNNKKIIQSMQKSQGMNSLMGYFSQIDASPLKKHEQADKKDNQWPQMSNWKDKQQNYYIIDNGHTSIPSTTKQTPDMQSQRFHTFQQFYNTNREESQNRIRKQLERTDFLKTFSICTDQYYSGFTSKLLQYIRQQCAKKTYILTSLSSSSSLPVFSLPHLYQHIDIYIPIQTSLQSNNQLPKYPYFTQIPNYKHKYLAPYFSCLLTPFAMKEVDPYHYVNTILVDNRKLFNSAYTLPIIDVSMNLSSETNIFRFEQVINNKQQQKESNKQVYKKLNYKQKQMMRRANNNIKQNQQEQQKQNRINFTNQSYLNLLGNNQKGKFISQSYILKGHFNNIDKLFSPKQEAALSMKYMQGIFASPQSPSLNYHSFYHGQYSERVDAYPFHLVMFSHQNFGNSIRKELKSLSKMKIFNQQWSQMQQNISHIADSYMQVHEEDND